MWRVGGRIGAGSGEKEENETKKRAKGYVRERSDEKWRMKRKSRTGESEEEIEQE